MSPLILLVENDGRQFESLSGELKSDGWEIKRAIHKDDALVCMRNLEKEQTHLDAVAIDLGLPPEPDNVTVGMDLIREIREQRYYRELPTLAYTSQQIDFTLYASIVRRLMTMKVSLIYLRPMDEGAFANVMKYVRQDYVLLSPAPASYLPSAVPDKPDPLSDELWETLESLSYGYTHHQAANMINISQETVRSRMDRARQILIDREEVLIDAHQEEILEWFRENRVRYARDQSLLKNFRKTTRNI